MERFVDLLAAPPPPPLSPSQASASAPRGFELKIFGAPSVGTIGGPKEEGGPSQTPPPLPPSPTFHNTPGLPGHSCTTDTPFARVPQEGFWIFGCQNPLSQGGGRKGLPRSFLNRFSRVHVDAFSSTDLFTITTAVHPTLPEDMVRAMIRFNGLLQTRVMVERRFGTNGAPFEVCGGGSSPWGGIAMTSGPRTCNCRTGGGVQKKPVRAAPPECAPDPPLYLFAHTRTACVCVRVRICVCACLCEF